MAIISPVCYIVARPRVDAATARACAPLALVNVLNLVCGLMGTSGLNVPMFIALRRFTLLCTLMLEFLMYRRIHERTTYFAVAVMITGALVAAASDLSFNAFGYMAVLGNDLMTSMYLILVKDSPHTLTTTGVLFYNATLSLPLLAGAVALSGEPELIRNFPLIENGSFRMVLLASAALGLTINHSTFLCTRVNEPLLTSVAGNLKNVIMTILGAIAFSDFEYTHLNAAGLVISMTGAIYYATHSALKAQRRAAVMSPQPKPVIGRERASGLALLGRGLRPVGSEANLGSRVPSFSDSIGVSGSSYRRVNSSDSLVRLDSAGGVAAPSGELGQPPQTLPVFAKQ